MFILAHNPKIVLTGIMNHFDDTESTKLSNKMHNNIKEPLENDRHQIWDQMEVTSKLVPKFVEDLKIDTPLAWELFRSILTYAIKGREYIHIKKVAAIATLCEIKKLCRKQ